MRKGAVPKPIPIGQPRELHREDLERLKDPRFVPSLPQKLKDSHHRIARLAATGLRQYEIAQRTGYSTARIGQLLSAPAMEELVAKYRAQVDEAFVASVDEYYDLATRNMLAAERHIADRIADLDEEGSLLGIREALAISRDAADRFGYGKKQTNVNVNLDFAAQLEKAIKRSGKQIEGHAQSSRAAIPRSVGQSQPRVSPEAGPPLRIARRA